jgi:hypothetical protein
MASTYNNLKLEIMSTGEQSGLWGATTNQNLNALQQAVGGQAAVVFASDADKTLAYTNTNADQDFRAMYLNVTSGVSLTATRSLIVPAVNKLYVVKNATTGGKSITVKIGSSTGTTVANGETAILYATGTDVVVASVGLNYFDEGQMLDTNGIATQYFAATGGTLQDGVLITNVVIQPKGYGYIATSLPDGTATGGNARGLYAVDFQLSRGSATQVAAGQNSVLFGNGNTIDTFGANAVIGGGFNNSVSGNYSIICGGLTNSISRGYSVISGGANNTCNSIGDYGVIAGGERNSAGVYGAVTGGLRNVGFTYGRAGGYYATTGARYGSDVFASGSFSTTAGTAQATNNVLRIQTTNATPTRLTADGAAAGAANTLNLANNSSLYIKGQVVARNTSTGDTKVWTFEGAIKRGANAAATALVAAITPTAGAADAGASAWALAVAADTTNGGLSVTATGAAATTIRWVCRIDTTEVMNG